MKLLPAVLAATGTALALQLMSYKKSKDAVSIRVNSMKRVLMTDYGVDEKLAHLLAYIGEATAEIQCILSNYVDHSDSYVGTQNASGDDQLKLDVSCDEACFRALRACGLVRLAASEETPVETDCGGADGTFAVGFDPLDGSSIIGANFSIGSIFGIWPLEVGKEATLIGRTGREQVSSVVSMYGPRTTVCIALPSASAVVEFTLVNDRRAWKVSRKSIKISPKGKIFAPGNLRASNDNVQYEKLLNHWISERYTLRYTGGMVPDVYHIFVKEKGVFSNVSSEKAKAKLRLLYEVAPMGLIVETAGGLTTHESQDISVLDIELKYLDQRLGVCFGSADEVKLFKDFLFLQ